VGRKHCCTGVKPGAGHIPLLFHGILLEGVGTDRIEDKFFESVEKFRYLGTTLTNQNCIAEEIDL
jgi:hypothetical protein